MKENCLYVLSLFGVILVLGTAGCVAPPTESASPVDLYNPHQFDTPANNTSQSYVTEATLSNFVTSTTTPLGYTTFAQTTRLPADISCRIYTKSEAFGFNGSAFTFDLKNPPMYINYLVVPTNVTVTKVVTSRTGSHEEQTLKYSDYSPDSWFEITVRNQSTGEIYLDDGFGKAKGYSTYLNHTVKVLNRDNVLVEFRGNSIIANTSIWVKPLVNFNDTEAASFTDCTYWDQNRDTVATPVQTTAK